jgi:hypothetical protein
VGDNTPVTAHLNILHEKIADLKKEKEKPSWQKKRIPYYVFVLKVLLIEIRPDMRLIIYGTG